MSNKMRQGEGWLADVRFKGTHQTKQRPVVIVGNELALDVDVIIAPVTSQKPRNQETNLTLFWSIGKKRDC